MATVLRAFAIAIALAGMLDPVVPIAKHARPEVTIALVSPPRAAGASEASSRAEISAAAMADQLRGFAEPVHRSVRPETASAACLPSLPCIVVSDGALPERTLTSSSVLLGVIDARPTERALTLSATPAVLHHIESAGRIEVEVFTPEATPLRLQVADSGVVVGEAEVTAESGEQTFEVEWTPYDDGVRRLQVRAFRPRTDTPVATTDVGVRVLRDPVPVVVFDARPSWMSTFVRRALDADPRFVVDASTRLAPGLVAPTVASNGLTRARLEGAPVVIVGAPTALGDSEVELLTRYVEERGGSLVLLPNDRLSGPAERLFTRALRLRAVREPLRFGPLRASEFLELAPANQETAVAGSPQGEPVISEARGAGRVVVHRGLDAWRFTDADELQAFERFWQATIAEAAALGGGELEVQPEVVLAPAGRDVTVHVRRRRIAPPERDRVQATAACDGAGEQVIRLWPTGVDRYAGTLTSANAATCQVLVRVDSLPGRVARAEVQFAENLAATQAGLNDLRRVADAAGARVVRAGDETALVEDVRDRVSGAQVETVAARPFRSAWWLLPFAGCLLAEWRLRRARGLR